MTGLKIGVLVACTAGVLAPFAIARPTLLYPNRAYLTGHVDRDATSVTLSVADGTCVGAPPESPASRVERVEAYERPHAVVVTVWMRPERGMHLDDPCAGIGLPPFKVRVPLPSPIGNRALVSSTGPWAPKGVLLAPREHDAAGVFRWPEYLYEGHNCDAVGKYFRGPRADWCAGRR